MTNRNLPSERQKEFLEWEFGIFFHFGLRTFTSMKDTDKKHMEADTFCPTKLDCEQWISTIADAGAKYAVLVTKHHDGFAMWPSKYTDYSVKNSPWKNGNGDVVREFVDACRKFNIKVGLYYNPSQWGMEEQDNDAYNDYVVNQATELLSNYGKIDYIWFDGAGSEKHQYDVPRIVHTIRTLQSDIMIFNMWDPDTRWIGNEAGIAPMYNTNVVDSLHISVYTDAQEKQDTQFLPGECDCQLSGTGYNWFWCEKTNRLKSVPELMGMYDYSVGRGSNMLLNVSPDPTGQIHPEHCKRLLEFGAKIRELYDSPIADYSNVELEENGKYTVTLPYSALVNTVILEEAYADRWIEEFEIGLCPQWGSSFYKVYMGETVGHKRICRFPELFCDKVRICTNEKEGHLLKNILITYVE